MRCPLERPAPHLQTPHPGPNKALQGKVVSFVVSRPRTQQRQDHSSFHRDKIPPASLTPPGRLKRVLKPRLVQRRGPSRLQPSPAPPVPASRHVRSVSRGSGSAAWAGYLLSGRSQGACCPASRASWCCPSPGFQDLPSVGVTNAVTATSPGTQEAQAAKPEETHEPGAG